VRDSIRNRHGAMAQTAKPVQLKPQTLMAFDEYIREAEAEMERTLNGSGPFLWSEVSSERSRLVRGGQVVAQFWTFAGLDVVSNVDAPASIMLLSALMFMLAVVWRELIRSRQLALGTPSFLIRAIHAGSDMTGSHDDRSRPAEQDGISASR